MEFLTCGDLNYSGLDQLACVAMRGGIVGVVGCATTLLALSLLGGEVRLRQQAPLAERVRPIVVHAMMVSAILVLGAAVGIIICRGDEAGITGSRPDTVR